MSENLGFFALQHTVFGPHHLKGEMPRSGRGVFVPNQKPYKGVWVPVTGYK